MKKSKIHLQRNFETLNQGGNFTGEIFFYIQEDDFYFPEKHWNDFIVTLLNWWLSSLIRLKNLKGEFSETLDFMDGSFSIKVTKKNEETLKLVFLHGNKNSIEIEHICYVSLKQFNNNLLSNTHSLLKELKLRNWSNEEVVELENKYNKLKRRA